MEKDITALLEATLAPEAARALPPVVLAWIGDGVFTDAVRKYLALTVHAPIGALNRLSVDYVRAGAQARAVHALEAELSPAEQGVVRRGRNTASQVPKNASVSDYRYATGFEALLGFLALTGQHARAEMLCARAIAILKPKKSES